MATTGSCGRRLAFWKTALIAASLCIIIPPSTAAGDQRPHYAVETEILQGLLANYSLYVPPQTSIDQPVQVKHGYAIQNIVYINERQGYIALWMVANISWSDPRLAWHGPANSSRKLAVPATSIWTPELLPIVGLRRDTGHDIKVTIDSQGVVIYEALWEVDIPCFFDLTKFPFDEQQCEILLASKANDLSQVAFEQPTIYDDRTAQAASAWHHQDWMTGLSASTVAQPPLQITTVNLGMKRKSSYYYWIYVVPANIVMLALPLIHLLPPGSHEKMTLAALLLLSVTIMHTLIAPVFPAFTEATIPNIVHLYGADVVMLYFSMLAATVTSAIAHKGSVTRPVPRALKYLMDKFSFVFCVRDADAPPQLTYLAGWLAKWAVVDVQAAMTTSESASIVNNAAAMATDDRQTEREAGDEASRLLRVLVAELQYGRHREQLRLEWLQLALVADRLLALLFFVLTAFATVAFAN